MIIRIFRAEPKPGKGQELLDLAKTIAIPFVDRQPGLIARYTGKSIGATGEELLMISIWNDVESMKSMTGEDWESEVIPDERIADRIAKSSLQHYESVG